MFRAEGTLLFLFYIRGQYHAWIATHAHTFRQLPKLRNRLVPAEVANWGISRILRNINSICWKNKNKVIHTLRRSCETGMSPFTRACCQPFTEMKVKIKMSTWCKIAYHFDQEYCKCQLWTAKYKTAQASSICRGICNLECQSLISRTPATWVYYHYNYSYQCDTVKQPIAQLGRWLHENSSEIVDSAAHSEIDDNFLCRSVYPSFLWLDKI